MMRNWQGLAAVAGVCLLSATSVQAQQWGSLKGRLVYDGAPPKAIPISVTKDVEFCGKFGLVDEELTVNPDNAGLANVVIWIYVKAGDAQPAAHPSFDEAKGARIKIDNKMCRFEPHVVTLRAGQSLEIHNSDAVGHNTKIDTFVNPPINYTVPSGQKIEQKYEQAERLPAAVSCSIHPWMKSWLVVQEHPYIAVTDKDGNFELKNVPVGTWTFQFWQERSGFVDQVTVDGQATEWKRGRVDLEIKAGELDLGTIKVSPENFTD